MMKVVFRDWVNSPNPIAGKGTLDIPEGASISQHIGSPVTFTVTAWYADSPLGPLGEGVVTEVGSTEYYEFKITEIGEDRKTGRLKILSKAQSTVNMRLQPLKFIGHKIGPFDHVELNWQPGSRSTLIVAENGMGKTTLITAIAACLSFGISDLFPMERWQRIAHGDGVNSYAALKMSFNDNVAWIIFNSRGLDRNKSQGFEPPPDISAAGKLANIGRGLVQFSLDLKQIPESWRGRRDLVAMGAAYGTHRDIRHTNVTGAKQITKNPLGQILDPLAPIDSGDIYQWIINQHTLHALALADGEEEEARTYLSATQRLQDLLSTTIDYPLSFRVKRNPLQLEIMQDDTALTMDQLSDGTRAFLSWVLDYLTRAARVNWIDPRDSVIAPGVILVDELDAHLHPEWQRRIMPSLRQLLPETHIIATTHSPFIVGSADDVQIFRVYRDENGSLAVDASPDDLYGYPADLVLEKVFVSGQFGLYTPDVERKLRLLSDLARKVASGEASDQEKQEHDNLFEELARFSPWLASLLSLSNMGKN
jgi:hypothetical protein